MKLITTLILTLFAGSGIAVASEKFDTLSYAYGHQYTIATMAGKNDLMQSEQDFRDYIRGLEENIRNLAQMNDSSYMLSYSLGAMDAIFMTDGIHHKKKEDLPPFPCIIAGLRKVGNDKITLPADTIAAMDFINQYTKDGKKISDLGKEIECKFFTAYGIMKAYQPGLQKYINEMKPGTACIENRKAYATGMADVLEAYSEPPKTAYDMGRSIALSMSLSSVEKVPINYTSFVAGAKASLGLGEQIISRDEVEEIFSKQFEQQVEATGGIDYEANFEKIGDYIEKLEIEPFNQYKVDWKVTAGRVTEHGAVPTDIFNKVISDLNCSDEVLSGILMAQVGDEDNRFYEKALMTIKKYNLPNDYKWFCGRIDGLQTTIGIIQIKSEFVAKVDRASVDIDTSSGMINVQWRFDERDALKWAEFTEASIGKHVAVEINGRFMFAPRVNQQITGGSCAISGISPEEINCLFRNAEKTVNKDPVETIEIIDLK